MKNTEPLRKNFYCWVDVSSFECKVHHATIHFQWRQGLSLEITQALRGGKMPEHPGFGACLTFNNAGYL